MQLFNNAKLFKASCLAISVALISGCGSTSKDESKDENKVTLNVRELNDDQVTAIVKEVHSSYMNVFSYLRESGLNYSALEHHIDKHGNVNASNQKCESGENSSYSVSFTADKTSFSAQNCADGYGIATVNGEFSISKQAGNVSVYEFKDYSFAATDSPINGTLTTTSKNDWVYYDADLSKGQRILKFKGRVQYKTISGKIDFNKPKSVQIDNIGWMRTAEKGSLKFNNTKFIQAQASTGEIQSGQVIINGTDEGSIIYEVDAGSLTITKKYQQDGKKLTSTSSYDQPESILGFMIIK